MLEKNLWGAHLFMPANNAGYIFYTPLINAKNIILDLEYATNIDKKIEARYLLKYAISYLKKLRPDMNVCVRINLPWIKKFCYEDIKAIIDAEPDSLRIPSVRDRKDIELIENIIDDLEQKNGKNYDKIKFQPMIESPKGFSNIREIAGASKRNIALCLGGEDWAYNVGLERHKHSRELEYVRVEMVTVAAEYGLFSVDTVYPWLDDKVGFEKDSKIAREYGMCARAIQNPKQLNEANEIYKPSEERYKWAEDLLSSVVKEYVDDCEVFIFHNKIIDSQELVQANKILAFQK